MTGRTAITIFVSVLAGAVVLLGCSPSETVSAPDELSDSSGSVPSDESSDSGVSTSSEPSPSVEDFAPFPDLIFPEAERPAFPPDPSWAEFGLPENKEERAALVPTEHEYFDGGQRKSCKYEPRTRCPNAIAPQSLSGANLRGSDFRNAKICGGLDGKLMIGVDFRNANLQNACLGSAFTRAVYGSQRGQEFFNSTNWTSSRFNGARLQKADFLDAVLTNVDFSKAQMQGARLQSANLSGARLVNADLSGANLRSSRLDWADLSGANFRGADLEAATFDRADVDGADFRGANLSQISSSPFVVDWSKAKTDSSTRCPDGSRGPCASMGYNSLISVEFCRFEDAMPWETVGFMTCSKGIDRRFTPNISQDSFAAVLPWCAECASTQWVELQFKSNGDWITVARGPLDEVRNRMEMTLRAKNVAESSVLVPTSRLGTIEYRVKTEFGGAGRPREERRGRVEIEARKPESDEAIVFLNSMKQAAASKPTFSDAYGAAVAIWDAKTDETGLVKTTSNYAWLYALYQKANESPRNPYNPDFWNP
jgi:hypothetical protein